MRAEGGEYGSANEINRSKSTTPFKGISLVDKQLHKKLPKADSSTLIAIRPLLSETTSSQRI